MFNDLPDGFVYQPDEIETGKFIAAGSYGAVFRATLTRNDERIDVAVKVPNNTDAGSTVNIEAKRDAEKNKKLKEGALTLFTTGIYACVAININLIMCFIRRCFTYYGHFYGSLILFKFRIRDRKVSGISFPLLQSHCRLPPTEIRR